MTITNVNDHSLSWHSHKNDNCILKYLEYNTLNNSIGLMTLGCRYTCIGKIIKFVIGSSNMCDFVFVFWFVCLFVCFVLLI